MTTTRCGYEWSDVRKSLRDAIDRRDVRAAHRWAAEFVVTPSAVGSLWAAYWMAWSIIQTGPSLPILLRQSWDTIADMAHTLDGDWTAFRNEPEVRTLVTEMTLRFLNYPRQTPMVWPTKEIVVYDVAAMKTSPIPSVTDGPVVLGVWQRNDDSLELRFMAGRFIAAIESGDLRSGLSAVAWSFLPQKPLPIKCAERGPASITAKMRASPLWFWLELGGNWLRSRQDIHAGWATMHTSVESAFRDHYKRWTPVDRMKLLLCWILQLRASMVPGTSWTASSIHIHPSEVDLPYKEIAAELADPDSVLRKHREKDEGEGEDDDEKTRKARSEKKMADADAIVLASYGM